MYECTLPEVLELRQINDIREAQQKAIDIDDKVEEERERNLRENTK